MKISGLTEFELIDRITAEVNANLPFGLERLVIGIGDDTAVIKPSGGYQLATMDALVEGVHFERAYLDWEALGWKALAVNLSDIAAMGGRPAYALVSLALPVFAEVGDIVKLYRGMTELGARSGAVIAGGNLTRAGELSVHVALTGTVSSKSRLLLRSKARAGDLIAVTGNLGGAAAGLAVLKGRLSADVQVAQQLTDAFWRPQPRLETGGLLVQYGVRCAIDISDGLLADLGHIINSSHVGARLESARIPVNPAAAGLWRDKAVKLALSGGEDYELLFTARPDIMADVIARLECPATVIGEVTRAVGQIELLDGQGNPMAIESTGWRHF